MLLGRSGKEPEKPKDEEPPEPSDADLERKLSLLEQHIAHRAIGLLELGFSLEQTLVLVRTPDIVHLADDLLSAGCSVETAFDILS